MKPERHQRHHLVTTLSPPAKRSGDGIVTTVTTNTSALAYARMRARVRVSAHMRTCALAPMRARNLLVTVVTW